MIRNLIFGAFSSIVLLLFLTEFGDSLGFSGGMNGQQQLLTRFCYNSANITTVNSQCVLCNYFSFDSLTLGCTGSSAITTNITSSQAFCIISQCISQVPRQNPVLLGRRRRWIEEKNENQQKINRLNAFMNMFSPTIVRNESVDVYNDQ